ncbi:MAG: hypothetical protein ACR2K9_00450 [Solirubrobacteraceae bacterium]
MILTELKIAPEIVKITYTALIGAVALGSALAFGLGGREVAGKLVGDAYGKGKEEDVKDDLQKRKERGPQQAEQAKDKAQERTGEAAPAPAQAAVQAPARVPTGRPVAVRSPGAARPGTPSFFKLARSG